MNEAKLEVILKLRHYITGQLTLLSAPIFSMNLRLLNNQLRILVITAWSNPTEVHLYDNFSQINEIEQNTHLKLL